MLVHHYTRDELERLAAEVLNEYESPPGAVCFVQSLHGIPDPIINSDDDPYTWSDGDCDSKIDELIPQLTNSQLYEVIFTLIAHQQN